MCVNIIDEDSSLTRITARAESSQMQISHTARPSPWKPGKTVLYLNFGAMLCNSGQWADSGT